VALRPHVDVDGVVRLASASWIVNGSHLEQAVRIVESLKLALFYGPNDSWSPVATCFREPQKASLDDDAAVWEPFLRRTI
jgi:hypothetical protein